MPTQIMVLVARGGNCRTGLVRCAIVRDEDEMDPSHERVQLIRASEI